MGPLCYSNSLSYRNFLPLRANAIPETGKNSSISRNVSLVGNHNDWRKLKAILSVEQLPPNAFRRKNDPKWRGGFSLGVDLGLARTGLALSKGFIVRPLTVLEMRGQQLELRLLKIAEDEEVDEFIIGLPRSSDGKETPQSNKVRSVAGRFAARAAERGLTMEARQKKIDAYAAVMVLERYFSVAGNGTELVVPKQLDLQDKLRNGPPKDTDFYPAELKVGTQLEFGNDSQLTRPFAAVERETCYKWQIVLRESQMSQKEMEVRYQVKEVSWFEV